MTNEPITSKYTTGSWVLVRLRKYLTTNGHGYWEIHLYSKVFAYLVVFSGNHSWSFLLPLLHLQPSCFDFLNHNFRIPSNFTWFQKLCSDLFIWNCPIVTSYDLSLFVWLWLNTAAVYSPQKAPLNFIHSACWGFRFDQFQIQHDSIYQFKFWILLPILGTLSKKKHQHLLKAKTIFNLYIKLIV